MRGILCALIFCVSCKFNSIRPIPIDNGVEGEPEIECGSAGVVINFNTREPFAGRLYIKGRFEDAKCRNSATAAPSRRTASLNFSFSDCGTDRARSLQPRGMTVQQTVVISFHPQFLTKVDRAYAIQCFYMEADKTVSQDLQVSELSTVLQSENVPMPICRYDILDGSPVGSPVKFASIGQPVFHRWTCESDHQADIFCMLVKSCFVDDGSGNVVKLLDDEGCATDKFLLQNLEYSSDLVAGREAHVFKYADKAALLFSAQISLTVKEPGEQCPRPACSIFGGTQKPALPREPGNLRGKKPSAEPTKISSTQRSGSFAFSSKKPKPKFNALERLSGGKFLYKREVQEEPPFLGTWDVRAQPISTFDIDFYGGEKNSSNSSPAPIFQKDCFSGPTVNALYLFSLGCILLLPPSFFALYKLR